MTTHEIFQEWKEDRKERGFPDYNVFHKNDMKEFAEFYGNKSFVASREKTPKYTGKGKELTWNGDSETYPTFEDFKKANNPRQRKSSRAKNINQ